jgi:VCBS repeat-containing protein
MHLHGAPLSKLKFAVIAKVSTLALVLSFVFSAFNTQTGNAQGSSDGSICNTPAFDRLQEVFLNNVSSPNRRANPRAFEVARQNLAAAIVECYSKIDVTQLTYAEPLTVPEDSRSDAHSHDLANGIISANFVLGTQKWGGGTDFDPTTSPQIPGGTVFWSLMPSGLASETSGAPTVAITDLPTYNSCFMTELENAFAAWQAVSNIQFVQIADSNVAVNSDDGYFAHIRIGAHAIDGASAVLAHAYFPPPNGGTISGDLHFDIAENWQCTAGAGQLDFGVVALHEIGHTIGLQHSSGALAVMNAFYNPSLTSLQSDDINGARALYGNSGVPGINIVDLLVGPYPATKEITGLGSIITDVNVTLSGLYHFWPEDMDMLLVSPGGQAVILMSDACGTNSQSNLTITFDDSAAPMPATSCSSATYRPTAYGEMEIFPSPAPASGYSSLLSAFNGSNPNGTWQLYIDDDTLQDTGGLVSWSLAITATDGTPVANNDSYSVNEDNTLNVVLPNSVLANDTDANGDTLTASVVTNPSDGTLNLNADGTFQYTPNANFNGTDSFTYQAYDGQFLSNMASVTITVNAQNDTPVANNDSYSTSEDTALNVPAAGILSNDSDVDSNTLSAVKVTDPASGTLVLNTNGQFTYTPNNNFFGVDSFTYTANDGGANSNIATVTITVNAQNDAPLAVSDNYSVNEDGTLTVPAPGLLTNDTDAETDPLTAVAVTQPASGSLTLNANGSFSYTPNANFNGSDSFTYQARDANNANSNSVLVQINVAAVNDAPSFTPGAAVTIAEDSGAYSAVWATNISTGPADEGLQTRTFNVTNNNNGLFSVQPTIGADGTLTFTPTLNASGTATVSVTLSDNGGTANGGVNTSPQVQFTITINEVNDPPTVTPNTFSIVENAANGTVVGNVSANDPESGTFTYSIASGNTNGTFAINSATGEITVANSAGLVLPTTFSLSVNVTDDGVPNQTGSATIIINVADVNDAPSFASGANVTSNEDTPYSATWATSISAGPTDENGQVLTFNVSNDNNTLFSVQPAIAPDGRLSYTPASNLYGSATVTVSLSDNGGTANGGVNSSPQVQFTIAVTSVNDGAPSVSPASFTIGEGSASGTSIGTVNASDPADAPMTTALTYSITGGDPGGVFAINAATGAITLVGELDFESTPSYSLTVTVTDSDPAGALSTDGTVDIAVTDVDDTSPSVSINQALTQSDPTSMLPITYDVLFSEAVTGFDNTDVSLAGSTANISAATVNVLGSGTTYTVSVNGVTNVGTVVVSIIPGASVDSANNASLASTSTDNSVTYDPSVPTVTITRTGSNPSNDATVQFTLTFSQDVTGVDTDPAAQTDFQVVTSGSLSGVSIASIVGSGNTYTVIINTGTGTGTITLNLLDDDSIQNGLGVLLGGAGVGNGDVSSPAYTIRPPQTAATPVSTVVPLPPCALLGGGTNSIVRASVPGAMNADVFCRILVENGTYIQTPAEVGDQSLIDAGVLQSVDVFGFTAAGVQVTRFNQPVTVCLQGNGRMFFRDATNAPRTTTPLTTTSQNGYTCAAIPNAGTVVLVR